MSKNLLVTIGTGIEMCGVAVLTYIALKRNSDCYKAECKLIDAQKQLILKELEMYEKDEKIKKLKKENELWKGLVEDTRKVLDIVKG
jgi:hypothetical protein